MGSPSLDISRMLSTKPRTLPMISLMSKLVLSVLVVPPVVLCALQFRPLSIHLQKSHQKGHAANSLKVCDCTAVYTMLCLETMRPLSPACFMDFSEKVMIWGLFFLLLLLRARERRLYTTTNGFCWRLFFLCSCRLGVADSLHKQLQAPQRLLCQLQSRLQHVPLRRLHSQPRLLGERNHLGGCRLIQNSDPPPTHNPGQFL